jgi:radical SAM protein with 4Fe4S-binding SPASM domain
MSEFKFYPQNCVWEITFACNMKCIHCGTSAGKARPDELTTDEALALIDELAGLGCETITLSGGEPLLRKDWKLLAQRIKERGIKPYLITNGYAVTEEVIKDFEQIQFANVGVSLDGTEKIHNFIRQRDDSWRRAVNALKLMQANGRINYCVVSQISNINLDELDEIRKILIDCGCKVWRIQMTTSTGRMQQHADMVMSLENYPKLIDKLLEFKKDNSIEVDVGENIGYYGCKGTELLEGAPYLGCYAGTRVVGIESNGNVKGCLSMQEQFVEGNIRQSSFTEIWNNPNGFAYNRRFTRETAGGFCRECKYLPLCRGGCTTTSVSATGCLADNPYCIYQIERRQGITCQDNPWISELLARFSESTKEREEAV